MTTTSLPPRGRDDLVLVDAATANNADEVRICLCDGETSYYARLRAVGAALSADAGKVLDELAEVVDLGVWPTRTGKLLGRCSFEDLSLAVAYAERGSVEARFFERVRELLVERDGTGTVAERLTDYELRRAWDAARGRNRVIGTIIHYTSRDESVYVRLDPYYGGGRR